MISVVLCNYFYRIPVDTILQGPLGESFTFHSACQTAQLHLKSLPNAICQALLPFLIHPLTSIYVNSYQMVDISEIFFISNLVFLPLCSWYEFPPKICWLSHGLLTFITKGTQNNCKRMRCKEEYEVSHKEKLLCSLYNCRACKL